MDIFNHRDKLVQKLRMDSQTYYDDNRKYNHAHSQLSFVLKTAAIFSVIFSLFCWIVGKIL